VLADLGGNDAYTATSISNATLDVADNRSPDGRQDRLTLSALAGKAYAHAQGWGVGGVGLLLDASGTDSYVTDVRGVAAVTGTGAAAPNTIIAGPGVAESETQGAGWADFSSVVTGLGALLDGGGADHYTSTSRLITTEGGEPSTMPGVGMAQAAAKSNGFALLADIDGGASDTFSSFPAVAPCVGVRGEDVWRDCGAAVGVGVNQ
jgi:hypothetical protein